MKMKIFVILSVVVFSSACGASEGSYPDDVPTQTSPLVSRVDPTGGSPGSQITIFGLGFSSAAPNNIVVIGGAAVAATAYTLIGNPTSTEIEALTATVPTGAAQGITSVAVVVYDNASNADVTFTVTP